MKKQDYAILGIMFAISFILLGLTYGDPTGLAIADYKHSVKSVMKDEASEGYFAVPVGRHAMHFSVRTYGATTGWNIYRVEKGYANQIYLETDSPVFDTLGGELSELVLVPGEYVLLVDGNMGATAELSYRLVPAFN